MFAAQFVCLPYNLCVCRTICVFAVQFVCLPYNLCACRTICVLALQLIADLEREQKEDENQAWIIINQRITGSVLWIWIRILVFRSDPDPFFEKKSNRILFFGFGLNIKVLFRGSDPDLVLFSKCGSGFFPLNSIGGGGDTIKAFFTRVQ